MILRPLNLPVDPGVVSTGSTYSLPVFDAVNADDDRLLVSTENLVQGHAFSPCHPEFRQE